MWTIVHLLEDPPSAASAVTLTNDGDLLLAGSVAAIAGRDLWLGRFTIDGAFIDTTTFGEPITYYSRRSVATTGDRDAIVCGSVVRASAANAMFGRFTLGSDAPPIWLQRIESQGEGSSGCDDLVLDRDERAAFIGWSFHPDRSFEDLVGRLSADGEILWSALASPTRGFFADFGEGIVLGDAGDFVVVGTSQIAFDDQMWLARIRG